MSFIVLSVLSTLCSAAFMDCAGAAHCGILVLERGGGSGNYNHETPVVHGLWVQEGQYGNSACVSPGGKANAPIPNVSCYDDDMFQSHEWTKHGVCAANDPTTYFKYVCGLSREPLELMTTLKLQGDDLDTMADAMARVGYGIYGRDYRHDEIQVSACAGKDGVWMLSPTGQFKQNCGN